MPVAGGVVERRWFPACRCCSVAALGVASRRRLSRGPPLRGALRVALLVVGAMPVDRPRGDGDRACAYGNDVLWTTRERLSGLRPAPRVAHRTWTTPGRLTRLRIAPRVAHIPTGALLLPGGSNRKTQTTTTSTTEEPTQPTRVRHSPEVQSRRQALLRGPVESELSTGGFRRCSRPMRGAIVSCLASPSIPSSRSEPDDDGVGDQHQPSDLFGFGGRAGDGGRAARQPARSRDVRGVRS